VCSFLFSHLKVARRCAKVFSNPLAPGWLKRVRELLITPSQNMINLVAAAKHSAGEQWHSPYNDRVTMISVKSIPLQNGWRHASHRFSQPVDIVALWLMADGDNTHSSFSMRVRNIMLD